MATDPHTVRGWLIALAQLTVPLARADLMARIDPMVPLLAEDFPSDAFSRASLKEAAAACEHFPAYAVVRRHLRDHAQHSAPAPTLALPDPHTNLDPLAQAWVRRWNAALARNFADAGGREPAAQREHLLSLIRAACSPAYDAIMADQAAGPAMATAAEVKALTGKLAGLSRRVAAGAPPPLPPVVPDPQPSRRGQLTAEQLAAARERASAARAA